MKIEEKPHQVKKFYLLEYFYVLLKSIEKNYRWEDIFETFKELKSNFLLGESKYKRLKIDKQNRAGKRIQRTLYTFMQVLSEAIDYGLISEHKKEKSYQLTSEGQELLLKYEKGHLFDFNKALFMKMENRFYAFHQIINFCYEANKKKGGLLVFPGYTPIGLGFEKSKIKTSGDIEHYLKTLQRKLEDDIKEHLNRWMDLTGQRGMLIKNLIESGLLPGSVSEKFDPDKYNSIIIRIRKFWLGEFLKKIYGYKYSYSSFDIWTYRGKQIGVIHATEFYPGFSGKIIYPTSVITNNKSSLDFEKMFSYSNGDYLYIHSPSWEDEKNREKFVDSLLDAYFNLKKASRSYYINLADTRELVCYNMKISQHLFNSFLEKAYFLNLKGQLKVKISLEADKLPQETGALYLKRDPVMVDGKYRNIIAIDVSKRR